MAKTPHDSSFSSSKRYFQWRRKKDEDEEALTFNSFSSSTCEVEEEERGQVMCFALSSTSKKKKSIVKVTKLQSVLTVFTGKNRCHVPSGPGNRVIGTLFGYRHGRVHFAFQEDPKVGPAVLIELAEPTDGLVLEMASGVVRIALECDNKAENKKARLLEEPIWSMYCNGRKCGSARRRECGLQEWKVLRVVEPISVGAGVLPGNGTGSEDDIMYMRARFERVVGSRDSQAFYMINPGGSGGPELSIYFLRV